MNGVGAVGSIIVALVIGLIGLLLDRRDKKKAEEKNVQIIPDNSAGLGRFRKWVRDAKAKTDRDFQP